MKILYTMVPSFVPHAGGVQRVTYNNGKYFSEQGLEVYYYSTAHEGHDPVEYGSLLHAPAPGGVKNPRNMEDLAQKLAQVRPDVVINQMPYEKELRETLSTCKLTVGFQLIGCLHNSLFNFKNNVRDRMRIMLPNGAYQVMNNPVGVELVKQYHRVKHRRDLKAIIDHHDRFVLLAPPNRSELEYFVGDYKAEKVIAIPNAVADIELKTQAKGKYLLHVGRLDVHQKRSDLLLPFWEQVHARLPDWSFVIVGDGPYLADLKARVRERGLPRVELAGYQVPDRYYRQAAIFMMPSAFEGFPNTILEAQSYGCALVAFDSYQALRWIVNDGKDALLVPPFEVKAMADEVVDLARDDARRAGLQRAAQRNVQRFTREKVGRQWMEFFAESNVPA